MKRFKALLWLQRQGVRECAEDDLSMASATRHKRSYRGHVLSHRPEARHRLVRQTKYGVSRELQSLGQQERVKTRSGDWESTRHNSQTRRVAPSHLPYCDLAVYIFKAVSLSALQVGMTVLQLTH